MFYLVLKRFLLETSQLLRHFIYVHRLKSVFRKLKNTENSMQMSSLIFKLHFLVFSHPSVYQSQQASPFSRFHPKLSPGIFNNLTETKQWKTYYISNRMAKKIMRDLRQSVRKKRTNNKRIFLVKKSVGGEAVQTSFAIYCIFAAISPTPPPQPFPSLSSSALPSLFQIPLTHISLVFSK